jgi:plastocyanin
MKLFTMCGAIALAAISLSVSAADDKKGDDKKAAVMDVKFSCPVHGPKMMTLTLSHEAAPAGTAARTIKMTAVGGAKWNVTIGGTNAPAGGGGNNNDTIKVHTGDTIVWVLKANTHGVAFAEKDRADAMLKFEMLTGQTLKDLTLGGADWTAFGSKLWGIEGQAAGAMETEMAKATVK